MVSSVTSTSSAERLLMQSRMVCSTVASLLSTASKCGSHKTGATGSFAIDALIRAESGLLLLWTLKIFLK